MFRIIVEVHMEPYAIQWRRFGVWTTVARCLTDAEARSVMSRLKWASEHVGEVVDRAS